MSQCDQCNRPATRTIAAIWTDEKDEDVPGRTGVGKPTFHYHCERHPIDPTPLRYVRYFYFDHVLIPDEWEKFASCLQVMES